ncbi:hypothetical protein ES707_22848 [subsurface metagenome]
MSLGEEKAPHANIPGFDVCTGLKISVIAKSYSFNSTPNFSARNLASLGGFKPTARTTM